MRLPGSTKMNLLMLAVIGALVSLLANPVVASGSPLRVMAYMTSWQIYARNTFPKDMIETGQAEHLTHLLYTLAGVSESGECIAGDAWADCDRSFKANESIAGVQDTWANPLRANLNQLKLFKEKYPEVKIAIAVGGAKSQNFSIAARTSASRKKFASSCIDLYIKGNLVPNSPSALAGVFDGIHLDWQWPTIPGWGTKKSIVHPNDKKNYALLATEVSSQLDAYCKDPEVSRKFELSSHLPADPKKPDAAFASNPREGKLFFEAMEWVSVSTYGFSGTWNDHVGHQANMYIVDGDQGPGGHSFSAWSLLLISYCV